MSDKYFDFQNNNNENISAVSEENRTVNVIEAEDRASEETASRSSKTKRARRTARKGGFWRKACSIALTGILVGGISAGVFLGVVYTADANRPLSGTQTQTNRIPATLTTQGGRTDSGLTGSANSSEQSASGIVKSVMPSIVAITNSQVYENYRNGSYYDFFQYYFGQQNQQSGEPQEYVAGAGSGIIVSQTDEELLIVTNNHVIEGASSLTITFADGSTALASVKGTDEEADLAVVAVKLSDLSEETRAAIKVATLGNSDDMEVGDSVIAIGNAMGYGQSVTRGIVSALNRNVTTSEGITRTLIQTDAAINPGNSGGALVNMNGEVIGINSAKLSDTDVEGMGYAIPVTATESIITDLMNRQTREIVKDAQKQSSLGIQGITIDSSTAQAMNMPAGVLVSGKYEGSSADTSALNERDVITKFDGQKVSTADDIKELLKYYEAGTQVELTVQRIENGEYVEHTVAVTLGYANQNQQVSYHN